MVVELDRVDGPRAVNIAKEQLERMSPAVFLLLAVLFKSQHVRPRTAHGRNRTGEGCCCVRETGIYVMFWLSDNVSKVNADVVIRLVVTTTVARLLGSVEQAVFESFD
jgi:hypothetical protein